jgi:integrase
MECMGTVTPGVERVIRSEVLRKTMLAWAEREAKAEPRSAKEADTALADAEAAAIGLRKAIRLRDASPAVEPVRAAAAALGIVLDATVLPRIARASLGALADLADIGCIIESGAGVEEATRQLREIHFGGRPLERLAPPVRLAAAVAEAVERAPTRGMTDKVRTTGDLLIAFFGADAFLDDVLTKSCIIDFLMWWMRLPRLHGKKHGRNRYTSVGVVRCKHEEIAEADANDAAIWTEISARTDLTHREKLVLAGQRYEPRLTDEMVEKHHARVKAVYETARESLDWDAPAWESRLKAWREAVQRQGKAISLGSDSAHLTLRVTMPKRRSAWSEERLAKLLNSTVYRGCFSEHRRWRPGPHIVRDHAYWAPLICLLCGMRPEEVLRLLKSDVLQRDGVLCFRVEERPDGGIKTDEAKRLVPVPETLLRLGFLEWWQDSFFRDGPLLFPEATVGTRDGKASGSYGKRQRRIRSHLGIADWNEDGYALRHTFLTALDLAGAPDSVRQAIAGHEQGEVINRHYTDTNLKKLKGFMDLLDFGIEIDDDDARGFPTIRRCTLADGHTIEIAARLEDKRLVRVIVRDPMVGEQPVIRLDLTKATCLTRDELRARIERAAERLSRLHEGRRIRIINEADPDLDDRAVRQAVMSFMALGAVTRRVVRSSAGA